VIQVARDADNVISHFFEKSGTRGDPTVPGQLLLRMLDLNRAKLGGYLSRRTSKIVLKVFIGCFGFGGVRIDKTLRAFLQSIHLAPPSWYSNPLEYVLDSFAGHCVRRVTSLASKHRVLPPRVVLRSSLLVCATSRARSTIDRHHRPFVIPFQFPAFHHCSFDSDSSPRTLKPFVFVQFSLNTYAVSLPS
jgi:hypothetical protein